MNESTVIQTILNTFSGVETTENFGYQFFFYEAERMHPFATLANADYPYDQYSNLDRPGVFRLNIGVSRQAFQALFGTGKIDTGAYDYTALDTIMPHPEYASQQFVCVLNPGEKTWEHVQVLLADAYERAVQRQAKRTAKS